MAYNTTEGAPHNPEDVGKYSLGVRRDADTSPVDADGKYHSNLYDNAGNLKVTVKSNLAEGDGGTALTALDDTYDGTPSSNVGADITSTGFRSGSFSFTLETTAGTPTDITFTLQEKIGSNYHNVLTGPWGAVIFESTAFTTAKNLCVPIAPRDFPKSGIIRIIVDTVGTDGSNIFVLSNSTINLQT